MEIENDPKHAILAMDPQDPKGSMYNNGIALVSYICFVLVSIPSSRYFFYMYSHTIWNASLEYVFRLQRPLFRLYLRWLLATRWLERTSGRGKTILPDDMLIRRLSLYKTNVLSASHLCIVCDESSGFSGGDRNDIVMTHANFLACH